MANIGFNPIPNISLGDMENIFDMENEIALMSEENATDSKQSSIDKSNILKQFMLVDTTVKQNKQAKHSESSQKLEFKVTEARTIEEAIQNETDDEELRLRERIRAAEEARRQENERIEKLRKLQREAELAEEEARLARQKREAEQRRIDEERRLREIREAEQRRSDEIRAKQQLELERLENQRRLEQQKLLQQQREENERLAKELERIKLLEKEKQEKAEKEKAEKARQEKIRQMLIAKKQEEKRKAAIEASSHREKTEKPKQNNTVIEQNTSQYDMLDVDALYNEVRKFLKAHNVEKKIIDVKVLENKFGKSNIKKLLLKSYLISIGKGVTVGK